MAIHILVPQERLAELLFAEHELMCVKEVRYAGLGLCVDSELMIFDPSGPSPEPLEKPSEFLEKLNSLLTTEKGLAEYLGYQYTVDVDADYLASLEDMLGDEE